MKVVHVRRSLINPSRRLLSTDIRTDADLLPTGAEPGTVPTDVEQATGLERFEILGKMQGVDVFDMRPLDASRKGMWLYLFIGMRWIGVE